MGTWILGASDPEMEAIEALLLDAGERVAYALDATGQRVRPADAYRGTAPIPVDARQVYLVECDVPTPEGVERVVIDHHRPGDPGYGRPPSEYMSASSIGQVLARLAMIRVLTETYARRAGWTNCRRGPCPELTSGWTDGALAIGGDQEHGTGEYTGYRWVGWFAPPTEILLAAAADHCLGAAYRGECPGVNPDALMRWRVETRARFQRRSVDEMLADIEQAREALRRAPMVILGAHPDPDAPDLPDPYHPIAACDMRGIHVAELPEAAAREGVCFVADGLPDAHGRVKVVCQSGRPDQIRAFIEDWAVSEGLVDIYGDPERGFAGGYCNRQLKGKE